jgi:hypothetical protein
MGWGGATSAFNVVANRLLDAHASPVVTERVCYGLAVELIALGWDTVDDSIGHFQGYPAVLNALYRAQGRIRLDADPDGVLDYDRAADEWVLLIDGGEVTRRPGTVDGHNILLRMWFASLPDTAENRAEHDRMLLR